MASHSVGHSAAAAEKRSGTVLLQSVTLASRTGGEVGRGAQRACRVERSESLRVDQPPVVCEYLSSGNPRSPLPSCKNPATAKGEKKLQSASSLCAGKRNLARTR